MTEPKVSTGMVDAVSREDPDKIKYIVGIGASAGGLEALEVLLEQLPSDTDMAFVIVQHLSRDFKSLMNEILQRRTEMAVVLIENGMLIEPNQIYVLPAGNEMIISEGRLLLADKDPGEHLTLPIDHFFRSLANDCGSKSVAIVLSGSGSDGSRGIREVHSQGGIVIAQDASSAGFDSMPNAAIATGVVDMTGAPNQIAESLVRLVKHPQEKTSEDSKNQPLPAHGVERILRILRNTYGIDFASYKPSTVIRRIERRLLLNHSTDLAAYVDTVSDNPKELNLLYKDLLIGVTQFFRDPDAFKILELNVIPELVRKTDANDEIRIWTAGCATGEEAYSIAILLHEHLTRTNRSVDVKVFATDVHDASLDVASQGVYDQSAIASLSTARQERYFTPTDVGYRVIPELRSMVVFAPHNLIKDPPFTRLDMVSCRNMMIYLQPQAQKKLLSLFHFGLKTTGVLFLGPSETVGELADEFETMDSNWRIYRKLRNIRLPQNVRLPPRDMIAIAQPHLMRSKYSSSAPSRTAVPATVDRELSNIYDLLLNECMPPALLLNEANELVHSFGNVGDLLRVRPGRASSNALDLLPVELRTVVIGELQRLSRTEKFKSNTHVSIPSHNGPRHLEVCIQRMIQNSLSHRYVLISFLETASDDASCSQISQSRLTIDEAAREQIDGLEGELRHSRENLKATIEEVALSNEKLQATNEEMIASNEELQSTNEELHSVNEELYTVNSEYQKKITELTEMTDDMDNLLNSTDVHTLFLDDRLRIRKFTPQIATLFNLISSDIGRSIDAFTHKIQNFDLMANLQTVLQNDRRVENEISTLDGDHYLLRILPYRGDTIRAGVVLTLMNITESKEAELRFRATFDNAAVGISHVDLSGRWLRVNDRLCEILGYSEEELLQTTFQQVTYPEDLNNDIQQLANLKLGKIDRYTIEKRYIRKNGDLVWALLTVSLQRDDSQQPMYAISVVQDISQRKQFEQQLSGAVEHRDRFLATLSHELRNPLAAVRHSLALLRHDDADDDIKERALDTVERQVGQVAHLLDDLLDVSRITQEKIRYQMQPLDLRIVVKDATDAMRPSFAARDQKLTVQLPGQPIPVKGDPVRLLQVVENLLTNACKYTPASGRIDIELLGHDTYCQLTVTDTGTGIDPDLLEEVFQLFMQSNHNSSSSHRDGGMGLGLTLVRSLIEHHNGSISAFSEGDGQGSRFTVTLPMISADKLPEKNLGNERQVSIPADKQTKIVLVEDNDDARMMLQTLLKLEEFDVTTAADGLAGVDEILSVRPDIAIVDIGLPGIDGYEVAKRVREKLSAEETYLIALTGYGQTKDILQSEAAGFDHHMNKPVDPIEFTQFLRASRMSY